MSYNRRFKQPTMRYNRRKQFLPDHRLFINFLNLGILDEVTCKNNSTDNGVARFGCLGTIPRTSGKLYLRGQI